MGVAEGGWGGGVQGIFPPLPTAVSHAEMQPLVYQ